MKKIRVENSLKGRPAINADIIVRLASTFKSQIYLEKDSKKINAKSIIGVLSLTLKPGDDVIISADGMDENAAIDTLASAFKD